MKFPEKFDLKLLLKLKEFLLDCCYVSLLWLSCSWAVVELCFGASSVGCIRRFVSSFWALYAYEMMIGLRED